MVASVLSSVLGHCRKIVMNGEKELESMELVRQDEGCYF